MVEGARAFHAGLDAIPEDAPATEKIRLALRSHLRVVADQLDVATVFVQEWRYLEGERRDEIVAERRRYEERIRALFREGREHGELRSDLDDATAALLALSAANWAYTWLKPGRDTDELADRFYDQLLDGMRGYATPPSTNRRAKKNPETRPRKTSMKNHGLRKLSLVAGSERGPRPTLTQHWHGFSRSVRFHMNPCQRCRHRYPIVLWHGPSGIRLPTPNPLFVR